MHARSTHPTGNRPTSDREWMAITMPNLTFHVGVSYLDPMPTYQRGGFGNRTSVDRSVYANARGTILVWG